MTYLSYKSKHKGAALIEFALVLPILLALAIGVIYYGYIFVLDAAVTHAAKQGAQVAVNMDPVGFESSAAFLTAVEVQINDSVTASLAWLPESVRAGLSTPPATVTFPDEGSPQGGRLLNINVQLAVAGSSSSLLPQVNLPGIGSIPPLPPIINGVAQVDL